MTGLQNRAESTLAYRGTSRYVGRWSRRGAGIYGERAAPQAEGIAVPPARFPVDSCHTVKTDRRDRHELAWLLEANLLKRVPVLTAEERAQREVLRMREGA